VAWTAAAAVLLLVPLPALLSDLAREAPGGLPLDKLVHVALFAWLGRSWLRAAAPAGRAATLGVALAAIAYGALLELLQGLGGERSAELLDLAADILGVLIALLARDRATARKR